MDLKHEILKEHSKAMACRIAYYVGIDQKRFKDLLKLYLAGPYRITQRAAYPLEICVERHPELIIPHLAQTLSFLKTPGIHNAVKRNTMRMLQFIEILKRNPGRIVSLCFEYLQSKREPVAIKVFSMTVLSKIIQNQPALQKELRIILEDQIAFASPVFLSRARKVLSQIHTTKISFLILMLIDSICSYD